MRVDEQNTPSGHSNCPYGNKIKVNSPAWICGGLRGRQTTLGPGRRSPRPRPVETDRGRTETGRRRRTSAGIVRRCWKLPAWRERRRPRRARRLAASPVMRVTQNTRRQSRCPCENKNKRGSTFRRSILPHRAARSNEAVPPETSSCRASCCAMRAAAAWDSRSDANPPPTSPVDTKHAVSHIART